MSETSSSSPTSPTVIDPASVSYLAWIDRQLDTVPVVAAANNSVDLALKAVFVITPQWLIESTAYTQYIDQKRWTKCVGCSALGFIYTTFFEDPNHTTTMIQKPNAAEPAQDGERSPLIEPEDLDIVPEVVPDSDDVATLVGAAEAAVALATLAGYRQAAQLYQQAEDLVRKELLWARSTQLKRLRLQVEDMIKTTIKEKEEEAERLSSLGTRAVISLDIQRIEEAVTLYARAAEIVKEFDSSKAPLFLKFRDHAKAQLLQLKAENEAKEKLNEGREHLQNGQFFEADQHLQGAVDGLRSTNASEEEIQVAAGLLSEATNKVMIEKVSTFIETAKEFHDDGEFHNALCYYDMAIEFIDKLPKPCNPKIEDLGKMASNQRADSQKAHDDEQSERGKVIYLVAKDREKENNLKQALEEFKRAQEILANAGDALADLAADGIRRVDQKIAEANKTSLDKFKEAIQSLAPKGKESEYDDSDKKEATTSPRLDSLYTAYTPTDTFEEDEKGKRTASITDEWMSTLNLTGTTVTGEGDGGR